MSGQIDKLEAEIARLKERSEHEYKIRVDAEAIAERVTRELHDATIQWEEANKELTETQEQLVLAGKLAAIGQLAGQVAHDVRNSLGAISNAAFYLRRRLVGSDLVQANPRIAQFLQMVDEEVAHTNQVVTDLMDSARVSPPSFSLTNVGETIDRTLSSMEMGENVRVVKKYNPALPEIMADREQLQHGVFMNLVSNARDAMPDGGELTITTGKVTGFVEVAFRDTGTGIDEDTMKTMFEPLFSTKAKHVGLGLAVVRRIIAYHGGTVDATSAAGCDTTFTVRLPISQDEP